MVLPAPAHLPARVLAAIAAAEGLGELHRTLAPTATWRSADDPDPLRDEVAERLTVLGWRGRGGTLEREVAASLTVLCRPDTAYYGWITRDHTTTAMLAAAIGKEAVLAVRRPDSTTWLSTIPAGRLAERLVAQLPDIPPGQGNPVTVSLAELHATRTRPEFTSTAPAPMCATSGTFSRCPPPEPESYTWQPAAGAPRHRSAGPTPPTAATSRPRPAQVSCGSAQPAGKNLSRHCTRHTAGCPHWTR